MHQSLQTVWNTAVELLFPRFCCGCGRPYTYLCPHCWNTIDCYSGTLQFSDVHPLLNEVYILGHYTGVLKKMIHTYKYDAVQELAYTLAELLWYCIQLPTADYITAVPLHPERERVRGFNQAELLAQHLSLKLEIPYIALLKRVIHTAPQASLSNPEERKKNILHQFQVAESATTIDLRKKRVLIVDDVTTTGATLSECTEQLATTGIASVIAVTIAHGG